MILVDKKFWKWKYSHVTTPKMKKGKKGLYRDQSHLSNEREKKKSHLKLTKAYETHLKNPLIDLTLACEYLCVTEVAPYQ